MSEASERELTVLQSRKLQLECEKLELESAAQRGGAPKPSKRQLALQLVPALTALISVAGFLWGVWLYQGTKEKERQTAEREFMKPWLESQRSIYTEALIAASVRANSPNAPARAKAEQDFWQLYHGRMVLVETREVSGAMVQMGNCFDRGDELCSLSRRPELTRALASAMAHSMGVTAKMTYEDFARNQFRYSLDPVPAVGP